MNIITALKKSESFPFVTINDFLNLKKVNDESILRQKHLIHSGNAAEKEEATQELKTLQQQVELYNIWSQEVQTHPSVYELLAEAKIEYLDEETIQDVLAHWVNQFTVALQHEISPLTLLPLLQDNLSTPILLSAMILCLLNKGITANDIINSELLHYYLIAKIHELDIGFINTILSNTPNPTPELTELLEKTKTTTLDVRGIGTMNLAGDVLDPNPKIASSYTPRDLDFLCTATNANWDCLMKFFGGVFLLQVLTSKTFAALESFFIRTIQECTGAEINALYNAIQTNIAENQRQVPLERFMQNLSETQELELLNSNATALWTVLSNKPQLITAISAESLSHLLLNTPITLLNIEPALQCAQKPQFESYNESIHLKALECLLNNATTEIEPNIIDRFKNHPGSAGWCELAHERLLSEFLLCIKENIPFTNDSYINIMDEYRIKGPKWRLLEKLTSKTFQYPRDSYGAQSYIISALFHLKQLELNYWDIISALFHLKQLELNYWDIIRALFHFEQPKLNYLNIFHPQDQYTSYGEKARTDAKIRTLLACLAEQDDEPLQLYIIEVLQLNFSITDWRQTSIGGVSLLNQAIEHENINLIKHYYKDIPIHLLLQTFKERDATDNPFLKAVNYPKSLETLLSLLSETDRLAVVKEKNNDGETVLHLASYNPESVKIILSLYPEPERLAAVIEKNYIGNTVLHRAYSNPELLKIIFSLLPEKKRLAAVKEKNNYGNTVLHLVSYNPESLKIILSLYPETERLAAVKERTIDGNTALHLAYNNPESLKIILSPYPYTERLTAVKEKNNYSETVLHWASNNPESLKIILSLLPETERLAAVNEKKSDGDTILHLARNNPESVKVILSLLPEPERLAAVNEKISNGDSVLHRTLNYPESLKIILSLLPETERLAAVKEKNSNGETVLHRTFNNPELLKIIFSLLPETEQLTAVKEKNNNGDTLLHLASKNPESLKIILSLLPETEHLAAVKEKNSNGETVLHRTFNNPELLKIIFSLLPETEQLTAVKEKNNNGDTLLHLASKNPESLKIILSLLSDTGRLAAVKEKNNLGNTVLYLAYNNPELLKIIISLLPEKKRLAAVKEKNNYGNTVLHLASHNPESLKIILSLLSETERFAAVNEKNSDGTTVLHLISDNPELLKIILSLYPEIERLAALKEKNDNGNTVLHWASYNPESLKVILSLLPETDRFAAVKEKNNGSTILHCACNNSESLKIILSLYPETERLAAVKEKNNNGFAVLHLISDNPESLKIILSLLPNEDVQKLKEDEFTKDCHKVFRFFSQSQESSLPVNAINADKSEAPNALWELGI